MDDALYRDRFARIFHANVARRSRTAKGEDKGGQTSAKKKPLLLQGEALAAKVRENIEQLVEHVLRASLPIVPAVTARGIREICEQWFDVANDGLYGPDAYQAEFERLRADAARLERATGERFLVNPRHRLWTPEYTTIRVPPILLERWMEAFYESFAKKMAGAARLMYSGPEVGPFMARSTPSQIHADEVLAELMAYADLMMDGELHPWMDGCSRVSTALMMWIAACFKATPPLFAPTKKEHYETIKDIDRHTKYVLGCFRRAEAEVPA